MTWHIDNAREPGKEMGTRTENRPVILVGTNPSPFHITCAPLFILAVDGHEREIGTHVFAPGESREVTVKSPEKPASGASPHDRPATPWSSVVCHAINDYGSIDLFKAPITRD
jgi:P pilus assembly chaperone PapD